MLAPLLMAVAGSAFAGDCALGKTKFAQVCQTCHTPAERQGRTVAQISAALKGGVPAMAGLYPTVVNDVDIDNIATYLSIFPASCPVAVANVSATPTSLAFGSVTVGSTSGAQTITVSNTGGASATNMSYPAAPADFTKGGTCSSATLAAGATCTVTLAYSPSAAGSDATTYTISGGGAAIPIALSGTGVAPTVANVVAAPASLAFGSVGIGSTSGAQTIAVSNTGTGAATDMSYPAAPAKFNKSGSCGSATLNAGASCTIVFTYSPTNAIADSAVYAFTGGGASINVALSGTGTAAPTANLSASPPLVAFGNVTVGETSGAIAVTVTNAGGAAASGITFASINTARFVVSSNSCGASLNAGASCSFNVAYAPNAAGVDEGAATLIYAGGSTLSISFSGTGVPATTPLPVNINQQGLTGSWYQAATSGQGIELEVFKDLIGAGTGYLQGSWFTFDANESGSADHGRWYTFGGNVAAGTNTTSLPLYQNLGGNFNAPPVTTAVQVGNVTMTFADCTTAQFTYTFTNGTARSGTVPLARLTPNVLCGPAESLSEPSDFGLSGNWFDPAKGGQGIVVEVNPVAGVMFLAWYTYAIDGQSQGAAGQRWFTGQAAYTRGARTIPVLLYETTGGMLDRTSPNPITAQVGTATLVYASCNSARMTYAFTAGSNAGQAGSMNLARVGPVPGSCAF